VLPFASIFIEMYFIFTSFFNYKFYYVWGTATSLALPHSRGYPSLTLCCVVVTGFLLLVCVILVLVTVCVTIVSTYLLLNSEDYRWQWTAFLAGASTAVYVYAYAAFYFLTKTQMTGALQTGFYFGYMFVFCFGLAILCGTLCGFPIPNLLLSSHRVSRFPDLHAGTIAFWGSYCFVRVAYSAIKAE
jgi:transmembrane 9 superfamily protein 3